MRQPPPRSTRTDTLFPYTTPSDLRSSDQSGPRRPRGVNRHRRPTAAAGSAPELGLIDAGFLGQLAQPGLGEGHLAVGDGLQLERFRSEEHTSELQSLMRISYAVFCLKKKKNMTTVSNV